MDINFFFAFEKRCDSHSISIKEEIATQRGNTERQHSEKDDIFYA
jgi:hypothetical protein